MQKISHNNNGTINNPSIRVLEAPPSPSPPPPPITTANGGGVPACASCRHQRKKCTEKCILAPFFPAEKTSDFQAVHKIFGVSNVTKIVKDLSRENGKMAVDSLIWEANCRMKDPVLGPWGEYQRVYERLLECQRQIQQANIEHQLIRQNGVLYNNKLSSQQCMGPYNNIIGELNNNNGNNGNSVYGIVGNNNNGMDNSRILNYGLQNMDKSSLLKPERDHHQQQHGSFLHSPQQMMNDFTPYHF